MGKINGSEGWSNADAEDMATGVFKHREGNWGFRANVPGGAGQQVKRVGFATMLAAYAARARYIGGEHDLRKGSQISVDEWFASRLMVIRETRRATTAANYRYAFDRMSPYIGELSLADLDEESLRAMYRKMATRYTNDTLTTTHGRLRAALRAAVRERKIDRCVTDSVSPPPGLRGRVKRTWTFEQLLTFTRHVSTHRDRAMWLLWVTTGVRRGEICGLYWPKVLLDRSEVLINWQRTITAEGRIVEGIPKTDRAERIVPINDQVEGAVREWRSLQAEQRLGAGSEWLGDDYVFTTYQGRPHHPSAFDDRLAHLAKGAGLPVLTPHELRHTYASRCLEHGMDVKLVSAMLGHSKVETTMNLYQHVNPLVAHEAANALAAKMLG
ncbi:tyrosine-type recombinase/integrase [Lapillicoccus jejuensis]|uniref:Site-specific recombinase XerD n=1 Tax=Lapillicoccus jejuensis TaxID=402171 RepID=A0A542E0E7_9MICO|nr:site-specific integrase [Lapillicoccus jejuensis]TQJ08813.1 site-specific recombinase XerD [Lapillicoccus jejuensis]